MVTPRCNSCSKLFCWHITCETHWRNQSSCSCNIKMTACSATACQNAERTESKRTAQIPDPFHNQLRGRCNETKFLAEDGGDCHGGSCFGGMRQKRSSLVQ